MTAVDVAILGASGYGGGELLRVLMQHPAVRSLRGTSQSRVGEPFAAAHPNLRGLVEGRYDAAIDWRALARAEQVVVFAALPHGELARQLVGLDAAWAAAGLKERLLLVDLSSDYRLADARTYKDAYGTAHPHPEGLGTFVYGLPEWNREAVRGARRIASAGCFATALQLALLPLSGLDAGFIAVTAVTGSSGSGHTPSETTHHATRAADFRAYKVMSHQHEAEVRMAMGRCRIGGALSFVPCSAPLSRGIFASVQCRAPRGLEGEGLLWRAHEIFEACPLVRLVEGTPRVAAVSGSPFADVAVHLRDGNVAVLCAIDNLGKGMATQAVQNMNLALGLPEDTGLRFAGRWPP